ncbi:MAG: 30S ribosomal protein S4 [Candidatus Sungbacteria bacterium RIFCSPLOWO2_02_FULL_51_17]|uniref:Small ribosomal subunit protein uS4 n=1 Tax=Candidatus Sungbacteria bacterium RIFCSPHIGHO2_02_FULL_51_29 TaxID=1802273 RepID=A0A1G2KUY9_9BACT|nr:MAG: 30S ribosomal protein S4 [Candidatus Sungbacteria bacterium RIFCSPHIGHO2_01_FULL_51_22]OHA02229.1 MAG: 30S ribosomal protein S4 [Candidatus Sungbacteria bacterium RIFCSPHIGHO2_02_FULL_51_29]OHA06054.1 MAG: 30S ribosomal protein S4 [Candidatus Sungbacteria bacterium RIFCSPLOWO2_01_FULL_51_34]OHA11255.1 MAG: 30S ribosomal protein S4 [Candidatus Sungbacteria bacterium RIFCSPLOWO2_02_FULL_51_17]
MPRVLEKVERRLGEKLYIKGERCLGPKCALNRKPFAPGQHGNKKKRRGAASEFSEQLAEKQKVRYLYGLSEKEAQSYFAKAIAKPGTTSEHFMSLVERRLDNVVFRAGFTIARSVARHLVSHGHVLVNGRAVTAPSYLVHIGDVIGIKESRLGMPVFIDLATRLGGHQAPAWIEMNKEKKQAKIMAYPSQDDMTAVSGNLRKVIEYYLR